MLTLEFNTSTLFTRPRQCLIAALENNTRQCLIAALENNTRQCLVAALENNILFFPIVMSMLLAATDCEVSDWEPWQACSATCGDGLRTRTRRITVAAVKNGRACPGLVETQPCQSQQCCE